MGGKSQQEEKRAENLTETLHICENNRPDDTAQNKKLINRSATLHEKGTELT